MPTQGDANHIHTAMTEPNVRILGADGNPLPTSRGRARALNSGYSGYSSHTAYDAADMSGQHMRDWNPVLWSPDGELNPYRDRIVSRVRDLVRNDGWASAAVTRTLDNVIGADFRPMCKPDYRALAVQTGLKTFDHVWADEFGRALEAAWRTWSEDPSRFCDAQRKLTIPQMMHLAFRHKVVDGDALGMLHWMPDRLPRGARYATVLQLIDPDRLSNPQQNFDRQTMRGGVEVDDFGAAIAYHIRKAHQGDWFSGGRQVTWERIPAETDWGRPIVVHDYDFDRASQHRGGAGILTPVLQRLKMLIKYDGTELDAAIINAIFGAYVTSPFDKQLVGEALGDGEEEAVNGYQDARAEFHDKNDLRLGGARLPILFPGESINTVSATRPAGNFAEFENAMLRNVAAGTGMSAQQISQNWSDVNYSSYRAAALEAWKTFDRRRRDFGRGFGQPILCAFAEEAMEVDSLPLPAGAPEFNMARAAYTRAWWIGPGRGYVDPLKERQGAALGIESGFSTLEDESAEVSGTDWRDNVDQRAIEIDYYRKRGVPIPSTLQGVGADAVTKEPEAQ
ncbi:Phage portal [Burkholderia cenocepacia H111]|uniref:phage portal protein n=1 Tax=Burkholderia cenocepacia TaxID=95486 RepID=UPI0002343503|nr:phage portal protein [Burkholderia cenocepacia]CDN60034.1 Phage portal [Burkholderia cenocepacia H111]